MTKHVLPDTPSAEELGAIRVDVPGQRQLDPQFVEDRPDPIANVVHTTPDTVELEARKTDEYLKYLSGK